MQKNRKTQPSSKHHMNILKRKLVAVLCAAVLLFSTAIPASAEQDPMDIVFEMITYYRYYRDEAKMDLDRLNEKLAEIDPAQAEAWANIMAYWSWLDNELEVPIGVLPDGLPEDDSLCIVVLGYALRSDGSMKSELVGRLEVALASAEKYPNAYVLCSGGGTASDNPDITEAKQMARWLRKQGISSDRIIVEESSFSTIANARNSCRILNNYFPEVKHLAIVSSQYHVSRGSLLFYAQGQMSALENSDHLLDVIACAGYDAGYVGSTEGIDDVARNLARLVGIEDEDADRPALSQLVGLQIEGETVYDVGTEPEFTVTAVYDTGYTRVVTPDCRFFGLDLGTAGVQTLTVAYTEEYYTVTETVEIELLPVETEPPPTTEPPATEATEPAPEVREKTENSFPVAAVCCIAAAAIALFLLFKKRRNATD